MGCFDGAGLVLSLYRVVLIWLPAVDGECSLYRVVLFCGVTSFLCIGLCLIHPEGELVEVFMCSVFDVSLLPRVLVSLVVGFPTGVISSPGNYPRLLMAGWLLSCIGYYPSVPGCSLSRLFF